MKGDSGIGKEFCHSGIGKAIHIELARCSNIRNILGYPIIIIGHREMTESDQPFSILFSLSCHFCYPRQEIRLGFKSLIINRSGSFKSENAITFSSLRIVYRSINCQYPQSFYWFYQIASILNNRFFIFNSISPLAPVGLFKSFIIAIVFVSVFAERGCPKQILFLRVKSERGPFVMYFLITQLFHFSLVAIRERACRIMIAGHHKKVHIVAGRVRIEYFTNLTYIYQLSIVSLVTWQKNIMNISLRNIV